MQSEDADAVLLPRHAAKRDTCDVTSMATSATDGSGRDDGSDRGDELLDRQESVVEDELLVVA